MVAIRYHTGGPSGKPLAMQILSVHYGRAEADEHAAAQPKRYYRTREPDGRLTWAEQLDDANHHRSSDIVAAVAVVCTVPFCPPVGRLELCPTGMDKMRQGSAGPMCPVLDPFRGDTQPDEPFVNEPRPVVLPAVPNPHANTGVTVTDEQRTSTVQRQRHFILCPWCNGRRHLESLGAHGPCTNCNGTGQVEG